VWFLVAVLGVVALLVLYAMWTARRLDRLHARVDAAAAALDGQLARRTAVVGVFTTAVALNQQAASSLRQVVEAAAVPGLGHDREVVENAVTRALAKAVSTTEPPMLSPST